MLRMNEWIVVPFSKGSVFQLFFGTETWQRMVAVNTSKGWVGWVFTGPGPYEMVVFETEHETLEDLARSMKEAMP